MKYGKMQVLEALELPKHTTTERNALTGINEKTIIYNSTTKAIEYYDGAKWRSISDLDPQVMEYKGGITVSTFNAITEGNIGNTYMFSDAGTAVGNKAVSIGDIAVFTQDFTGGIAGNHYDSFAASTPTYDKIQDNDGDTSIKVETSSDEDTIRIKTAGVERVVISNTGNTNFSGNVNTDGSLTVDGMVGTNTNQFADNERLRVTAASMDTLDNSRSASVDIHGNQHPTKSGELDLVAGGSNGTINGWVNGNKVMTVSQSGNLSATSFTGNGSALTNIVTSVNTRTGAIVLTKNDVGLNSVDNTSDVNKPISTATQTALDNKSSTTHTHNTLDDLFLTGKIVTGDNNANDSALSIDDNIVNIVNTDQMNNTSTAPTTNLRLARKGTGGTKYNPSADFQIGSHTAGLDPKTQMDIRLGHNAGNKPDTTVMTLKSDGEVKVSKLKITEGAGNGKVLKSDVNGLATWQDVATANSLSDSDGDTKIEIEKTTDEDTIRMSTSGAERVTINSSGKVGIGKTSPNAELHLSDNAGNKKIALYDTAGNDNQFYGFGLNASTLRYQIGGSDYSQGHRFYAGTGVNSSQLLMAIHGDKKVVVEGGLGTNGTNPNCEIQTSNSLSNRKISIYETANNDHQFYGLGMENTAIRYQVDNINSSHRFYAGTSVNSSNLLAEIKGDGTSEFKGNLNSDGIITANGVFGTNTNIGSDSERLRVTASNADTSDNSRSASIDLHGNQHANAGRLDLVAGGVTGTITGWVGNNQVMTVNSAGVAANSFIGSGTSLTGIQLSSEKAQANGYASLDASTKIPLVQLPDSIAGGLSYKGTWNASTNTPILSNGSGSSGDYYKVSVAGTTSIDGISSWAVGDWIISNGTSWDKLDQSETVSSVAGKTGNVTLAKGDVGLSNVDNTSDANKPVSTAQQSAINLREPAITKNTAFNKNFGTANDDVARGNHGHNTLNDLRISGTSYYFNEVPDAVMSQLVSSDFFTVMSNDTTPVTGDTATTILRLAKEGTWGAKQSPLADIQMRSVTNDITPGTEITFRLLNGHANNPDTDVLSLRHDGTVIPTALRLVSGATNGHILTSDANGNATWQAPSNPPLELNNNVWLTGKDSGGTAKNLIGMNASNIVELGHQSFNMVKAMTKMQVQESSVSSPVNADADTLHLINNGNTGITISSSNTGTGSILFGDSTDGDIGRIKYDHSNDSMSLAVGNTDKVSIASNLVSFTTPIKSRGGYHFDESFDKIIGIDYASPNRTGRLRITAGENDTFDNSQGASIDFHANQHASKAGHLDLVAGGSTGDINFWTNNTNRGSLNEGGVFSLTNTCSITPIPDAFTGGKLSLTGAGSFGNWEINPFLQNLRIRSNSTSGTTVEFSNAGTGICSLSTEGSIAAARGDGNTVEIHAQNQDLGQVNAHAKIHAEIAHVNGGDPSIELEVNGGRTWSIGVDNSDDDKLKIGDNALVGTDTIVTVTNNGNVGIGNDNPVAPLSLANNINKKKVSLYSVGNNNNQFYGFGVESATLRYQVDSSASSHKWYAGSNATTSTELMSLKGDGVLTLNQYGAGRLESNASGVISSSQIITNRVVAGGSTTLASTWTDISGCSITLSTDGTYRVFFSARSSISATGTHTTFRLFNKTTNQAIADSEVIGMYTTGLTVTALQPTVSSEAFVVINGSSNQIVLQGFTGGAGTGSCVSDSNGRTIMTAHRL